MKRIRKGQIEMFGLAIIVVLIAVIALFALRFMIGGQSGENIAEVKLNIQANNMANAILKANIGDKDIKSLIIGCCNGDRASCDKANTEIRSIATKGIDSLEYQLSVKDCNINVESPKFNDCKDVIVTGYTIKAERGIYDFKISLCKRTS